jgi:hypothetical protein
MFENDALDLTRAHLGTSNRDYIVLTARQKEESILIQPAAIRRGAQ